MSSKMELPEEFQNGDIAETTNNMNMNISAEADEQEELIAKLGDGNKEMRVIKRAKRPSKYPFVPKEGSEEGGRSPGTAANGDHKPLPYTKNSRKSRTGRRGLPKKGEFRSSSVFRCFIAAFAVFPSYYSFCSIVILYVCMFATWISTFFIECIYKNTHALSISRRSHRPEQSLLT
jgi:hypothetical protein